MSDDTPAPAPPGGDDGAAAGDLAIARLAKVSALRDFVTWAGRMDETAPAKGSAAFHHNSLVEACAAMADFYEQGRLDDRLREAGR